MIPISGRIIFALVIEFLQTLSDLEQKDNYND